MTLPYNYQWLIEKLFSNDNDIVLGYFGISNNIFKYVHLILIRSGTSRIIEKFKLQQFSLGYPICLLDEK